MLEAFLAVTAGLLFNLYVLLGRALHRDVKAARRYRRALRAGEETLGLWTPPDGS